MTPEGNLNGAAHRWYSIFAPLYDLVFSAVEGKTFAGWRRLLWSKAEGQRILEVGVGTGRNFPFYPQTGSVTAIDFNAKMLRRAQEKARRENVRVKLALMNVQKLAFADNSFDTVVSSLLFCEVKDPLKGLAEVKRVVRSGGKVVMLEHVISDRPRTARLMKWLNPLTTGIMGENINRDTEYNVRKSGLVIENVTHLSSIFRLIEARKKMIYMLK